MVAEWRKSSVRRGSGMGGGEIPAVCGMVRYGQLGYTESMSMSASAPTGAKVMVYTVTFCRVGGRLSRSLLWTALFAETEARPRPVRCNQLGEDPKKRSTWLHLTGISVQPDRFGFQEYKGTADL